MLVSTRIADYESGRIQEGITQPDGAQPESGRHLKAIFQNYKTTWMYEAKGRIAKTHFGLVLSGDKVVDDPVFKKALFDQYRRAIGGEMEGRGAYAACRRKGIDEWIIVKGICDWGESKQTPSKEADQILAAQSAVSFIKHVFSDPRAFDKLPSRAPSSLDAGDPEASRDQGPERSAMPRSHSNALPDDVGDRERKAEKRSEWAVDVRGTRERVVNATQRLTLDRTLEVAVVESAGVTRARLAEAEKILEVAAQGWTLRYWYPIDANAVSHLDQLLTSLRDRVGDKRLSLLVHGEGGDVTTAHEFHRRACAALRMGIGPTVVVGPRWQSATHGSVVWLRAAGPSGRASAALERRVDKAIDKQQLRELVDDPDVPPLSALAAIARSGDLGSGRLGVAVDDLLTRSSASVREAWEVLESGRAADPAAWAAGTREFVALVMRARGGAGIPLASLPTDLLREPYLHDEILRLKPGRELYEQLLALPEPVRRLLGFINV